jgi:phosphoglycolate phosphatase
MKTHILWDLDGTLTDPKEGIIRSIQYALQKFGRRVPPMDELLWCIGSPLCHIFPDLVPDCSEEEIEKVMALYRERFSEVGLYENIIYPEIPDLLAHLCEEKKMFLASSCLHADTEEIIEHFDLGSFFVRVHGRELDGDGDEKGDLIRSILESEGIDESDALIVGDCKHDILGAKRAGIQSVGITWGYGSRNELQAAGADWIFDRPRDLRNFLSSRNETGALM